MQKPATGANGLTVAAESKAGRLEQSYKFMPKYIVRRESNGLGHDMAFAVCRFQDYERQTE